MKFNSCSVFFAFVFSLLLASLAGAQTAPQASRPGLAGVVGGGVVGKVQSVQDGDTLTVVVDEVVYRIRLSDIDAPELEHCAGDGSSASCKRKGQPFAVESAYSLQELVQGRRVRLVCPDYDRRYQRSVCRVFVGNTDVNLVQVQRGLAWHNAKYSSDRLVKAAHEEARKAGVGLWSHPQPASPWIWRDRCWKHGECRYAAGKL